jgi:hypothetical protein
MIQAGCLLQLIRLGVLAVRVGRVGRISRLITVLARSVDVFIKVVLSNTARCARRLGQTARFATDVSETLLSVTYL